MPLKRFSNNQEESGRILFLGYDENESQLIYETLKMGFNVFHTREMISDLSKFDLVVSFGYKQILTITTLKTSKYPIVNLHISYLPFNRGMYPNFWSHFDGTPSGVTIHIIDAGIDTGPILLQKQIFFAKSEKTFRETWKKLIQEIELLFLTNFLEIYSQQIMAKKQIGNGTFHKASDLPAEFKGWDSVIKKEIERLKRI